MAGMCECVWLNVHESPEKLLQHDPTGEDLTDAEYARRARSLQVLQLYVVVTVQLGGNS